MEKLTEFRIDAFSEVLASDAPAPGGGSTAALSGALGAALTSMVCALTAGKKQFAEQREDILAVSHKAEDLRVRFIDLINRDTDAFMLVSSAFAMPKATDEEKAERSAAIQRGLMACTETPLEMMELAYEALVLAESLLGRFNENTASDLGVSALSLRTAICGAWLNVLINVGSLKDKDAAERYRSRGEELIGKALPLADRVYETVLTLV